MRKGGSDHNDGAQSYKSEEESDDGGGQLFVVRWRD